MKILAIDPSGNFNEGKGTTGWALFTEDRKIISCGQILAENFDTKFDYWNAIIWLPKHLDVDVTVIEDFLLYESRAKSQINSRFETPKIIGLLEYTLWANEKQYALQRAVDVKNRWTDEILVKNGVIQKKGNKYYAGGVLTSGHIRDAIRHGMHYITYKLKE